VGAAPKSLVHSAHTPLHLAFSCHLIRPDGRVLVTRRALTKVAWPGVWTNSVCGHPAPGESFEDAVARRAGQELGMRVHDVRVVLPDFRYRATDVSGVTENEICPVFIARTDDDARPDPEEVMDQAWVDPLELGRAVTAAPWALSPWLVGHAPRLRLLQGETPS
jgi:isopentenyl-diphosphate delta-isomerase